MMGHVSHNYLIYSLPICYYQISKAETLSVVYKSFNSIRYPMMNVDDTSKNKSLASLHLTDVNEVQSADYISTPLIIMACIFVFISLSLTGAIVVFCKKKNSVFVLQKCEEEETSVNMEMDDISLAVTESEDTITLDNEDYLTPRSKGTVKSATCPNFRDVLSSENDESMNLNVFEVVKDVTSMFCTSMTRSKTANLTDVQLSKRSKYKKMILMSLYGDDVCNTDKSSCLNKNKMICGSSIASMKHHDDDNGLADNNSRSINEVLEKSRLIAGDYGVNKMAVNSIEEHCDISNEMSMIDYEKEPLFSEPVACNGTNVKCDRMHGGNHELGTELGTGRVDDTTIICTEFIAVPTGSIPCSSSRGNGDAEKILEERACKSDSRLNRRGPCSEYYKRCDSERNLAAAHDRCYITHYTQGYDVSRIGNNERKSGSSYIYMKNRVLSDNCDSNTQDTHNTKLDPQYTSHKRSELDFN